MTRLRECVDIQCSNNGVWLLHKNTFQGRRLVCEDHLRGYMVDRYSVVNGVEYVGPEVVATNKLANKLLNI